MLRKHINFGAKVDEKPQGVTVNYDKLIQAWREGRVK